MLYTILFIVVFLGLLAYAFYTFAAFRVVTPDIAPQEKIVLVTGAASGIGKIATQELLKRGAKVIATDVNETLLREEFGSTEGVTCIKLDVTRPEDFANVTEIVKAKLAGKRLFGLVNNAGVTLLQHRGITEMTERELQFSMGVNVLGVARSIAHFYPFMKLLEGEAANAKNAGCIINIASIASFISAPVMGYYAATKHAVLGLSESLRREMEFKRNSNLFVRVSCLQPGWTRTPLLYLPPVLPNSDYTKEIEEANAMLKGNTPNFQAPEVVGKAIADCVFSSKNPALFIVEADNVLRFFYRMMQFMPPFVQDVLLDVYQWAAKKRIGK